MASPAKQVFVSYSSRDAEAAKAICDSLEQGGVTCWIAPRDLTAGARWGEDIVAAIKASSAVLIVFSDAANGSPQVAREVEIAVSNRRPLIPVRIADVSPSGDFEYFLGVSHWTDAFPGALSSYLPKLVADVRAVVAGEAHSWRSLARRLPKKTTPLIIASMALVVVLGVGGYALSNRSASSTSGDLVNGALQVPSGIDASPSKIVRSAADPCQAKLSKLPKTPVRDIDGIYPGMTVSEARSILLCRYPEATQRILPFTTVIPPDSSRRNVKRMEFTYPAVEPDHAGGTFSITYDATQNPVVLQAYHRRFYSPDRGPDPTRLISDFAQKYEPGRKLLTTELREDAYTVAYDTGGKRFLAADLAAAREQTSSDPGRSRLKFVSDAISCLAPVRGEEFEVSSECSRKIAIRVHRRETGIAATVHTVSTDMSLAAKVLADTPFP